MSRLKRHNKAVSALVSEIITAGKAMSPSITANELARRGGIAPETLSRMKNLGRADTGTLEDLAAVVGMRLKLVPQDEIKDKMVTGSFFDD